MAMIYQDPTTQNIIFDNIHVHFEIFTTQPSMGKVISFIVKATTTYPMICPEFFLLLAHPNSDSPEAESEADCLGVDSKESDSEGDQLIYAVPEAVRFHHLSSTLEFQYEKPALASIRIRCNAHDEFFTFELESVSFDQNPDNFTIYLAQFVFKLPRTTHPPSEPGFIQTDDYFIGEIPLAPTTTTAVSKAFRPRDCVDESTFLLRSRTRSCLRNFVPKPVGTPCPTGDSLAGPQIKVALVACPAAVDEMNLIHQVEREESLPYPTIEGSIPEGTWAKKHPDIKTSYLFVDIDNADRYRSDSPCSNKNYLIEKAQLGHFQYLVCYAGTWSESRGGMKINRAGFPPAPFPDPDEPTASESRDDQLLSGRPGIAALSDLVGDIHSAKINTENDPLLPDIWGDRKLKFGLHTLSWRTRFRNDMRLDDTVTSQGNYVPDLLTAHTDQADMLCEIANEFAAIYHAVGADFVFLDGVQGGNLSGVPEWYSTARVIGEFLAKLRNRADGSRVHVLSEASVISGYAWHAVARMCAGDFVALGVENYMDKVRQKRKETYDNKKMPFQLGWIGLLGRPENCKTYWMKRISDSYPSTTIEEIEYILNRSLVLDDPISIETTYEQLKANQNTDGILRLIGQYEQIRLSHYFDRAFLNSLENKDEWYGTAGQCDTYGGLERNRRRVLYRLVKVPEPNPKKYMLRKQVVYEFLAKGDGSEEWIIENLPPYERRPLRAKITALPVTLGFDHADNVTLVDAPIDFDEDDGVELRVNLDLSDHKAIGVKASGFEKGEILNITMEDRRGGHREFRWKISESESEQVYIGILPAVQELVDQDFRDEIKMSLRPFVYSDIEKVIVKLKGKLAELPARKVGPIKAIHQVYTDLRCPQFILNEVSSVYPKNLSPRFTPIPSDDATCECAGGSSEIDDVDNRPGFYEPWDYLTIGPEMVQVYDGNHRLKFESEPDHDCLESEGETYRTLWLDREFNSLRYIHDGGNHAWITVIVEGEPDDTYIQTPRPSRSLWDFLWDWVVDLSVKIFRILPLRGDPLKRFLRIFTDRFGRL